MLYNNYKHNYKINFFKKLLYIFLLLVIVIFSIFILIFNIPTENSNAYLVAYKDKKVLLNKNKNNKKIVFIGGSNLAFGLNSEEICKTFPDYKIINFGLHAGIGIRYVLKEVVPFLKKEDILIIIPEYENYFYDGIGGETLFEIIGIEKSFKNIDIKYLKNFSKILPALINSLNWNKKNNNYNLSFTYDRRGFNNYGDYTEHWKYNSKKTILPSLIKKNKISNNLIKDIEKIIKKLESNGIIVYLLPPVYQKSSYEINKEKITNLEEQMTIKFILPVKTFIYNDSLFFDTVYHLNKIGVDKRTLEIIKFLKSKKI